MTNIVITGCSSGIGLESALYLKDRMIKVYPTARDEKDVNRLKELGFSDAMLLDVTKRNTIKEVIKTVLSKDGHGLWYMQTYNGTRKSGQVRRS